jgi:hypothetical protein
MEYTYLAEIRGAKVMLNIAAPTDTNPLYKVTIDNRFLGCLFKETNYEFKVVWRASTSLLQPLATELGKFIHRTDEQMLQTSNE